jgi:hypothetical protein
MANQRERQKRQVKKRARREKRLAKRAAPYQRSLPRLVAQMAGLPKMSEALAEFAAPLLDSLGPDADAAAWRSQLLLAATVWNMSRVAQDRLDEFGEAEAAAIRIDLVDRLMHATDWSHEQCDFLVTELQERKRLLFPDDPRLVVDIRTFDMEGGGVHVMAASSL